MILTDQQFSDLFDYIHAAAWENIDEILADDKVNALLTPEKNSFYRKIHNFKSDLDPKLIKSFCFTVLYIFVLTMFAKENDGVIDFTKLDDLIAETEFCSKNNCENLENNDPNLESALNNVKAIVNNHDNTKPKRKYKKDNKICTKKDNPKKVTKQNKKKK